jgi:hypothetical protein
MGHKEAMGHKDSKPAPGQNMPRSRLNQPPISTVAAMADRTEARPAPEAPRHRRRLARRPTPRRNTESRSVGSWATDSTERPLEATRSTACQLAVVRKRTPLMTIRPTPSGASSSVPVPTNSQQVQTASVTLVVAEHQSAAMWRLLRFRSMDSIRRSLSAFVSKIVA